MWCMMVKGGMFPMNSGERVNQVYPFCRGETPALYTVLPEKAASVGGAVMGSSHVYDVAASGSGPIKKVWLVILSCSVDL